MPTPHTRRSRAFALLLTILAGCAAPALEVNDVLIDDFTPMDQATTILMPLAAFDLAAGAARERAEQPDAGRDEWTAAARSLFYAADARVQAAAIDALGSLESPGIDEVVQLEDRASERVRAEVESLTRAGSEYAERALQQSPDDVDALLYHALNTSLTAWAVPKRRALFEGLGSACEAATKAALAADEAGSSGAALRLRGRFLSKAPWPVGDRAEGLSLLQRAAELAPVRLNCLFLGDALYAEGRLDEARAAWQRAADAESDEDSIALAGYHLLLARERVAASAR